MADGLDRKVKMALDEGRLLILGVQVMLGFQFESFFQDRFDELGALSKAACLTSAVLLVLAVGLLILPSMRHRLVDRGNAGLQLLRLANRCSTIGLMPMAAALGIAVFIVLGRHFGEVTGVICGVVLSATAVTMWFGLGLVIGRREEVSGMERHDTSLSTKVEQVLTEARLIIPGGQAMVGFQFIAMLTKDFDALPTMVKIVHAAGLAFVAINVVLLMTPAALHRLSFGGEDSAQFLRLASGFVIAAPAFLAAGIAAELFVVFYKVAESTALSLGAALVTLLALGILWYALPLKWRVPAERSAESLGARAAGRAH
jgi:hypothetical protein